MFEKLDLDKIVNDGFDFNSLYYNIVNEDMDWSNLDKSFIRFTIDNKDDTYTVYSIDIQPTFIWGQVDRPDIMLCEKRYFNKKDNSEIKYERLFRAAESGIVKKHVEDIYNHIIEKKCKNFLDKKFLEIVIRDYNAFLEKGVKREEDPEYRVGSSPFAYNRHFKLEDRHEEIQ